MYPNHKDITNKNKTSVSNPKEQTQTLNNMKRSGQMTTEYANIVAAIQDDLESIGKSFLVRIEPSVAKLGRRQAGISKVGASGGTKNTESHLDDVSESKVLPCLIMKVMVSGVKAGPSELLHIPGLRPLRYFITDTGASRRMTSSRHVFYGFLSTDIFQSSLQTTVQSTFFTIGKLYISFPSRD